MDEERRGGGEGRGRSLHGCRSLAYVYNLILLLSLSASLRDSDGPAFPVAARPTRRMTGREGLVQKGG